MKCFFAKSNGSIKKSFIVVLSFFLLGFTPTPDDDSGSDPSGERSVCTFSAIEERGCFPDEIPDYVKRAANEAMSAGLIPLDLLKGKSSIWRDGAGPNLQHFEYDGESSQAPGLFHSRFYEGSRIPKIIDVSNLLVFFPDESQALALLLPGSERVFTVGHKQKTVAQYILVDSQEKELRPFANVMTLVATDSGIEQILIGSPRQSEGLIHYFASYLISNSKDYTFRFREMVDWAEGDKRGGGYFAPTYSDPVFPRYLEDQDLRNWLISYVEQSSCGRLLGGY